MRQIAKEAGVSLGLAYRYFESKDAFVLALYAQLSGRFEAEVLTFAPGPWPVQFFRALDASLEILAPHRATLRAMVSVVSSEKKAPLYAPTSTFSRARVQGAFVHLAREARPAVLAPERLGEGLYLAHLSVVLFWLLDQSPQQRATGALLDFLKDMSPMFAPLLLAMSPTVYRLVAIVADGILGEQE